MRRLVLGLLLTAVACGQPQAQSATSPTAAVATPSAIAGHTVTSPDPLAASSLDPLAPASLDPLAASSLDASIIIGAADSYGWLQVWITFSLGGREVDLGVGDSVQVNGVELSLTSAPLPHTYTPFNTPFKRADSAYEFTYQHDGKSTSIRIPSLAAPKITSPKTWALVDRAGLTITYEPARGGSVSVSISQTTANDSMFLGAREEPDTGTYTFDASMLTPLRPGPGWAWLELDQQVKTTPSDTGFKSVAITNNAALATVQIRLQ